MSKLDVIFEMESADPDDFLTLAWLSGHPRVELRGVVVTPGTVDQCRLVRWGLDRCGLPGVPIGAFDLARERDCVSAFHYKVYGEDIRTYDTGQVDYGPRLLVDLLTRHPMATLVTGAPPKNLGTAHQIFGELRLHRWVCQGGFAGEGVVEPRRMLTKFVGKTTCATFNLGGAPKLAVELIASDHIRRRVFVSKNVCHGVTWTKRMQKMFTTQALRNVWRAQGNVDRPTLFDLPDLVDAMRPGLALMCHGLDRYLEDKGRAKAMHDLVAAATAVDERVVTLREVELYRHKGEWGSRLVEHPTRTWISTNWSFRRFLRVLAE